MYSRIGARGNQALHMVTFSVSESDSASSMHDLRGSLPPTSGQITCPEALTQTLYPVARELKASRLGPPARGEQWIGPTRVRV